MKNLKPALTFNELIHKLADRGLLIDSPDKIKNLNYYFIRGYAEYGGLTLPQPPNEYKFIPNLHFSDLYNLYIFDSQFKSNILEIIGLVEKGIKTNLANILSTYQKIIKPYNSTQQQKTALGALCYLDPIIYKNKKSYTHATELLNEVTNRLQKNYQQNQIITHHINKYGGFYPAWVIFNYFQWGEMIEYIKYLDPAVYKKFITTLGCAPIRCQIFVANLHLIRNVRNVCAHFERLYAWNFYYQMPKCANNPILYHSLFYILKIIKTFCESLPLKEEWNKFLDKINILINDPNLKFINIGKMGFPQNWLNELKI